MSVKTLLMWLRALGRWLTEPRLVWLTLLWLLLALAISSRPGVPELHVRASGLLLQLLGLGTVAFGLRETRKLFGRPAAVRLFREWLLRFPPWHRDVTVAAGSFAVKATVGVARTSVWSRIDPTAPLTEQMVALTRNVEELNRRVAQVEHDSDWNLRVQMDVLHQEQEARVLDDSQLRARLEEAQTGGLYISFAGLIWLLCGTLLTTLSNEIAQWSR
jgi:hypothetical protein